jgi:hypothetical membrane protein
VRNWIAVPAITGPLALIGGWSLAQARQPSGYDPLRDTISALAARPATDSWIMTAGLALLGLAYVAAGVGLVAAGPAARAVLALGGLATVAVAALPQPNAGHVPAATVGFLALAVWPGMSRGSIRSIGVSISVALVVLLIWLGIELHAGDLLGLSERILAGAESLTPLAIAVALTRTQRPQ